MAALSLFDFNKTLRMGFRFLQIFWIHHIVKVVEVKVLHLLDVPPPGRPDDDLALLAWPLLHLGDGLPQQDPSPLPHLRRQVLDDCT